MPGKRQHFIPQFHQRRFGAEPRNKKTLVWRLDKKTGKPERVQPADEAVVEDYYSVQLEDGTIVNHADDVLGRFESDVAPVIERIVSDPGYRISGRDVQILLFYIVTLKQRTPQAREYLREAGEQADKMLLEAMLSDHDHYHRVMAKTEDDVERREADRLRLLEQLRTGGITMEMSAEGEVAHMLLGVEETTRRLYNEIGVECVRVPEGSKRLLLTSDHPVAHYDPTPRHPDAGVSFMSSPNSVTAIALDPRLALLLVQGHPQQWTDDVASETDVEEINLLTYAWAHNAIYGPSQQAVTEVRRLAKREPARLAPFHRRPPRVWIGRSKDDSPGPVEFTSESKHGTVKHTFNVPRQPDDENRRFWPPPERASVG
jgi:hypothetical protein